VFCQEENIFLKPNAFMLALAPIHPHILQWVPSALFPGVKQPRREPNRFPPSDVEFENLWTYNSTPAHACMKRTGAALLPPVL
jgi:hypothetical protein